MEDERAIFLSVCQAFWMTSMSSPIKGNLQPALFFWFSGARWMEPPMI
jgi:hypothetical protein